MLTAANGVPIIDVNGAINAILWNMQIEEVISDNDLPGSTSECDIGILENRLTHDPFISVPESEGAMGLIGFNGSNIVGMHDGKYYLCYNIGDGTIRLDELEGLPGIWSEYSININTNSQINKFWQSTDENGWRKYH